MQMQFNVMKKSKEYQRIAIDCEIDRIKEIREKLKQTILLLDSLKKELEEIRD